MNTDLHDFMHDISNLTAADMFKISQDLNTIEPSVGEVAKTSSLWERLTFLDWVSVAFVLTILVFAFMPQIKDIGMRITQRLNP